MNKPVIGITMGDPAGIGPEIIVKALSNKEVYDKCNPLVIGDKNAINKAKKICNINLSINPVEKAENGKYEFKTIDLVDLKNVSNNLKLGKIQAEGGKAAFDYIKKAVEMALANEVDAIATAPINKESLKAGGINYIGHTEILAKLTNTKDPLTMFQVKNLRVFFLTRHLPLYKACELITKERLLEYIPRCFAALKSLGITEGAIAVAGLNPHSGEHGLFGNEEIMHIKPAVEMAKAEGYNVEGPIGADSVFHLALQGRYSAVLSLYHDQGHIAAKTLDFERTIALTLGMPYLRTSVDHGTAFDIAGAGKASAESMIEAILLAAKYAKFYHE